MSEIARMHAALVCAALLGAALVSDARGAEPADTPAGLSIVWRMPGRKLERGATGAAHNAFSPDGRYVAIHDGRRVRVVEARSGKPVRDFSLDPSSVEPFSLAVSSTGGVALGLMGNAELFEAGKGTVRHWCVGACGAITSIAFSPDERFLAFQGTRGLPEWRSGLGGVVSVVDLERGEPVSLDAVASIAQVGFSADGRSFCAMSVTQLDDRQSFGVRVWNTSDWSVTRNIIGSKRTMRRVAPLGSVPYAGVSMNEGHIEARDLATDRVLWSVPLVPPDVDGVPAAPESVNLDLVEIAPTAQFVLSYEAPKAYDATGQAKGVIVIRRAADGEVEALYDAPRVSDLAIAPDGRTFAYSTATGQTYTAVARVPL
jgi:WD40 repeat protein